MFKYIIIIFFNLSIVLSQNIDELFEDWKSNSSEPLPVILSSKNLSRG